MLLKCVERKLNKLDYNFKQKFKKQFNKKCDSREVVHKFTHYLLGINKTFNLHQIVKNIENLDVKKLLRKK